MGLGGVVLPEGDVDNTEEHHKINAIGRNLQIEIEEAVKGHGHQTAQGADGHEKPKRIGLQFDPLDSAKAFYQKNIKPAYQCQKPDPAGFHQQLQIVVVGIFEYLIGNRRCIIYRKQLLESQPGRCRTGDL